MLSKRIIPCLDVKDGRVVKGVQFRNHEVVYDITASSDQRTVDRTWIERIARVIDIPFCVAGGIRTVEDGRRVLNGGADKISINSPALEAPELITTMAYAFGSQAVVLGVDSRREEDDWFVYQYTGDPMKT